MKTLLGSNVKLAKQNGKAYLIQGLTLAPHKLGGFESVCPHSTVACRQACVLWFTGRTVTAPVRNAAIERTRALFEDRTGFESRLCSELARHEARALESGLIPAVRLNVASDLDWSHIPPLFPSIQFYDYTKVASRILRSLTDSNWPTNYRLTLSYTGSAANWNACESTLNLGGNVACVFSTRYRPQQGIYGKLPKIWRNHKIVDGDLIDVRLPKIDGHGKIVGLRFKGSLASRTRAIAQGFCIDVGPGI